MQEEEEEVARADPLHSRFAKPPETVTWRDATRVTAPVPRFRSFEPVKVKSPPQACGLLLDSVIDPPDVLSIVVPAEIVNVPPIPRAVALLMFNVPWFNVVAPLNVFAPDNVSAPEPAFVSEKVLAPSVITPTTVSVLPETIT